MASTAAGQRDGITAEGPSNKYEGVSAHPEVDGTSDITFNAGRITYPWKTGQGAPESSGFALGKNRPD